MANIKGVAVVVERLAGEELHGVVKVFFFARVHWAGNPIEGIVGVQRRESRQHNIVKEKAVGIHRRVENEAEVGPPAKLQ